MKKNTMKKVVPKLAKNLLEQVLQVEANSTTCFVLHQPTAPKELARFRKNNDKNNLL